MASCNDSYVVVPLRGADGTYKYLFIGGGGGIQGETYDKMIKIKLRSEQLIHARGQG